MDFEIGDVVMFYNCAYMVIDVDNDCEMLVLTNGFATTTEVDFTDVVKIGHDYTIAQSLADKIKHIQLIYEQDLLENKLKLIDCIEAEDFVSQGNTYTVTGKIKQDGKYFYCQIHGENGYEWILLDELWDKFYK